MTISIATQQQYSKVVQTVRRKRKQIHLTACTRRGGSLSLQYAYHRTGWRRDCVHFSIFVFFRCGTAICFCPSENDMTRDRIVFSMYDPCLKLRLLWEPNLILEKAIDTCRTAEIAKAQIQAMNAAAQVKTEHSVHTKNERTVNRDKRPALPVQHAHSTGKKACRKCGKSHHQKL